MIEKLDGLAPCTKLQTLFISNNKIKSWDEVSKLAQITTLKDVLLVGNPLYGELSKDDVKPRVVKRIPFIEVVDGKMVDDSVRKKAEELHD